MNSLASWPAPFRRSEWILYAKPPFGGPEAVLAHLSRYTHRVAISNHRLIHTDAETVTFRWKDYRIKSADRSRVMRLPTFHSACCNHSRSNSDSAAFGLLMASCKRFLKIALVSPST